jgi:hypothetical protein
MCGGAKTLKAKKKESLRRPGYRPPDSRPGPIPREAAQRREKEFGCGQRFSQARSHSAKNIATTQPIRGNTLPMTRLAIAPDAYQKP